MTFPLFILLEIRVRSNPSPVSWVFVYDFCLLKYPMERFENENIFAFALLFKKQWEATLSQVFQWLLWQHSINLIQTFFVISVNNSPVAKI